MFIDIYDDIMKNQKLLHNQTQGDFTSISDQCTKQHLIGLSYSYIPVQFFYTMYQWVEITLFFEMLNMILW